MPLDFPRKFSHGHRVENADCYADVYIYPSGHWVIGTHTSMAGGTHIGGSCVNYSFMLFDVNGIPLQGSGIDGIARFGMPKEHQWCVAPGFTGGPTDRYDSVSGDLDPALLHQTENVGVVIYPANKRPNLNELMDIVKEAGAVVAGMELAAIGGTGGSPRVFIV